MRRILIFGATSAIAEATARLFAADGDRLFLTSRNDHKLRAIADDLKIRGATQVEFQTLDALDYAQHQALIETAFQKLGGLDAAMVAHGTLPDQKACEASFEYSRREFEINALSVISLLTHLANQFERQGHGTLVAISSVAGDRGRQSNYLYGSAKAAVTTFLQGLRNRLSNPGIHVVTIKPGFVDTPMTAAFEKGFLWVKPEAIAKGIYQAILKNKDVVYLPWFWQLIMFIICSVPEGIFKRTRL